MNWLPPRRSFRRLRSFHLSRSETPALPMQTQSALPSDSGLDSVPLKSVEQTTSSLKITPRFTPPLPSSTLAVLFILISILVTACISLAFIGQSTTKDVFRSLLDQAAQSTSGIVFLGEDVDVDIDEPSIGIRWSVVACGSGNYLDGSQGIHGAANCGLPNQYLSVLVDGAASPAFTYDPSLMPTARISKQRRSIQNLVQFDADYTLDVHSAHLYPFDHYFLTGTLRAVDRVNRTIHIAKLATIGIVSSWDISTADVETLQTVNSTYPTEQARDFDMHVSRPNGHRAFTMLMFTTSWILVHASLATVVLATRNRRVDVKTCFFASAFVCFAVPKLRDSMPDAPGLDGVLIDVIGLFPQMLLGVLCALFIFGLIIVRERDRMLPVSDLNSGLRFPVHRRKTVDGCHDMEDFVFPQTV